MLVAQHLHLTGKCDVFQFPGSSLQFALNQESVIRNI